MTGRSHGAPKVATRHAPHIGRAGDSVQLPLLRLRAVVSGPDCARARLAGADDLLHRPDRHGDGEDGDDNPPDRAVHAAPVPDRPAPDRPARDRPAARPARSHTQTRTATTNSAIIQGRTRLPRSTCLRINGVIATRASSQCPACVVTGTVSSAPKAMSWRDDAEPAASGRPDAGNDEQQSGDRHCCENQVHEQNVGRQVR